VLPFVARYVPGGAMRRLTQELLVAHIFEAPKLRDALFLMFDSVTAPATSRRALRHTAAADSASRRADRAVHSQTSRLVGQSRCAAPIIYPLLRDSTAKGSRPPGRLVAWS